jgi:hypothetical protein
VSERPDDRIEVRRVREVVGDDALGAEELEQVERAGLRLQLL